MAVDLKFHYPEAPVGTTYCKVPAHTDGRHLSAWGSTEDCAIDSNAGGMSFELKWVANPGQANEAENDVALDPTPPKHQSGPQAAGRWSCWIRLTNPFDTTKVYRLKVKAMKAAGGLTDYYTVDFMFKAAAFFLPAPNPNMNPGG